jgi:hypothetical protein
MHRTPATRNERATWTISSPTSVGTAHMGRTRAAACTAVVALALAAMPLAGQATGTQVTARLGIAVPDDAYQRKCGHASIALGADVQGRRQLFAQLSVEHFTGSGGGDVACLPIDPARGTAVGGLRLDGATRVGLGVGVRVQGGPVQLEGVVLGGLIAGRHGYTQLGTDVHRGVMPQVGGQASLVLVRWMVLSATTSWTRLTLDIIPSAGGVRMARRTWSPMTTAPLGVRWGRGGTGGQE